ncbi:MAG: radical SAM protein [Alphaproteobacteria bacterium]|uniref:Radical SAM protein n=1 Tax=Candidatus Nitrobium versatile TaxID=2884831 RepID=A0A953LZT9_9BACT|nr:radical SAM protein [Candidatus Nitrobium versatile]
MDTLEKLKILSADSQYDLACACGTGKEDRRRRGQDSKWLYPVTLPQGGYSVLLKTLLSNSCVNDCKYCPLRSETQVRRCTLAPGEIAAAFMEYLRRREAFGLFLSSAVIGTPDHTMDRINAVARLLRRRHGFKGYIHLKIIPGASDAAVEESLSLANTVSLNIETPGKKRFSLLSHKKDYLQDIIRPLTLMGKLTSRGNRFAKVKCTTQFIIGASDEPDSEIISSVFSLYKRMNFKRVYFSAYQKGLGHPDIPGEKHSPVSAEEPFLREHRLYQTDFLIRKYGFREEDFLLDGNGNLHLDKDPKKVWADTHPEYFPVRINTAEKEALLRVPGLGPETVDRILTARRERKITRLEEVGMKGKRLTETERYVIME